MMGDIRVQCAWCTPEEDLDPEASHGICDECKEKELEKLEEAEELTNPWGPPGRKCCD